MAAGSEKIMRSNGMRSQPDLISPDHDLRPMAMRAQALLFKIASQTIGLSPPLG
jgi:hypothetical protein